MSVAGATAGTTAATAAAAAIANAVKASGAIVRVEPDAFQEILARCENPLVIQADYKSFFTPTYQYLTAYRGFVFYAKSPKPIVIPEWCEIVQSKKIWIPA